MRGLNSKINEFYVNCSAAEADIILLTETWLHDNVASSEIFQNNFDVFRCDRKTGIGGGVLAAFKNSLNVQPLNLLSPVPKIELLALKTSIWNSTNTIFVVLYIPPSTYINEYIQLLEYLDSAIDFSNPVVIIGDFNIPELFECTATNLRTNLFNIYSHFMSLHNLKQHNSIVNLNNRILDLIITTKDITTEITKCDFPLVPEDKHHPSLTINLHLKVQLNTSFPKLNDIFKFNFRKANLEGLYSATIETDWSSVLNTDDVETACTHLYDIIYDLFNIYVPKLSSNCKNATTYPPWFNSFIISKIKEKNKLWNLYRKSGLCQYLDRTKILRRELQREIRQAYKQFITTTENSIQQDPKKFWSFMNQKRKTSSIPGRMVINDNVVTDPQTIVNAFAVQFASAFYNDSDNLCDNMCCDIRKSCAYCGNCCCSSLKCDTSICDNLFLNSFVIHDCDILTAGKKIKANCVCGPDDIPAFFVVDCLQFILKPLCHLYNLMLKTSMYPNCWKVSRVFPVFKAGDKSNISNYRPIALLCNFAKIFECILSNVIYAHVISRIVSEQHGFVKGRSTATNLCEFTQFISFALDHRLQVDVLYTDLTKAFDRVDHCILLNKLKAMGLCDNLLFLIKSLLFNRTQFVEFSGFRSHSFVVKSGVTQGSNLGPLLFIIFFNNVLRDIGCKAFIYADDLKIAGVIETYQDCISLQESLDKITSWCMSNKLQLNTQKCKKITFTRKNSNFNFYYNINGRILENCNEIRDLGVILDTTLSYIPHILNITNSALKTLGFICRNSKDFKNIQCIKQLYYSLVRTKLEYCCIIWTPCHQTYINLIENVNRKFCKYLYFKMFNCYPIRHCDHNSLISVVNENLLGARRNVACLIFLQNLINGKLSSSALLQEIKFSVPRLQSRNPNIFYYNIPSTFHHLNCSLTTCFRLYNNCMSDESIDIFYNNFNSIIFKRKLLSRYCINHII